ncbi:MAG: T9SS type A sorting domain-containing protein [Bacteroidetes bacterium]|nr:T9SS type A sorting domain-containing protein [Bacteroidota bacterium]
MKRLLLTTVSVIFVLSAIAQKTFQKTYGGTISEYTFSVKQTMDGGYIIGGYTTSFGFLEYNMYLLKINKDGDEEWSRLYGGTQDEGDSYQFTEVQQTTDSGYILVGQTESFGAGDVDIYLIKTDDTGTIQWNKTYGGTGTDVAWSVQQTNNGGYILGGFTTSFGAGGADIYIIRTDANGDTLWTKTYGSSSNEYCYYMRLTTDNGFVCTGSTFSKGAGSNDIFILKSDSNGNQQWSKTIGGINQDLGYSIAPTNDGGYVLTGKMNSYGAGGWDVYIAKLDSLGNIEWDKTFGGSGHDWGRSVQQTTDSGYIIVGQTISFGAGLRDMYLIKLDGNGNKQWSKTFGGAFNEYGYDVQLASDGGFIVVGETRSFGSGGADVYLVKTDEYGSTGCNQIIINDSITVPGISASSATWGVNGGATITSPSSTQTSPTTLVTMLCSNCLDLGANFSANAVCFGDSTQFLDLSFDSLDTITQWIWDFGDGIIDTFATSTNLIHVYSATGVYSVKLSVINNATPACTDSILNSAYVYTPYLINDAAITICAGDSALIYGKKQSVSSTYYDSLTTTNGCDSIHSTVLIINPAYSAGTANDTICDGDSSLIFGLYQKTAGTYFDSLTTSKGCDSVISTVLIVNFSPSVSFIGLDTSYCTTDAAATLTAIPPGGSFSGTGITGTQFDPATAGVGTHTITYSYTDSNGCAASDSQNVNVYVCTGIVRQHRLREANGGARPAYEFNASFEIYPNPNKGEFTIEIIITETENLELKISNGLGQIVFTERLNQITGNFKKQVNLNKYRSGIYHVQLITNKGVITRSLIIN